MAIGAICSVCGEIWKASCADHPFLADRFDPKEWEGRSEDYREGYRHGWRNARDGRSNSLEKWERTEGKAGS